MRGTSPVESISCNERRLADLACNGIPANIRPTDAPHGAKGIGLYRFCSGQDALS